MFAPQAFFVLVVNNEVQILASGLRSRKMIPSTQRNVNSNFRDHVPPNFNHFPFFFSLSTKFHLNWLPTFSFTCQTFSFTFTLQLNRPPTFSFTYLSYIYHRIKMPTTRRMRDEAAQKRIFLVVLLLTDMMV